MFYCIDCRKKNDGPETMSNIWKMRSVWKGGIVL